MIFFKLNSEISGNFWNFRIELQNFYKFPEIFDNSRIEF